ncbi:GntR family transcriptional regulator [Streptomyces sp. NPDC045456]|uniref:GntR family transcriptional regulator n=1 Tax=Streptomyces sp. NPDC045456 TaxID=3155254 RepID=UPI003401AE32
MTPPKWKMLADRIAKEIQDGTRAPGTALPHIAELAKEGQGSKATINRAYQDLEARGYVTAARGRGTVVRELTPARVPLYRHDPRRPDGRARWERAVEEAGLVGEVLAEAPEMVEAPPHVAEALGLDAGAPVLRVRHHAMVGGDVVQRDETWCPRDLAEGAGLTSQAGAADPLGLLAAAGLLSGAARDHVAAEVRIVTTEDADDSPFKDRSPVLRVDRVTRGSDGQAVAYVRALAAADRVRLSYSVPLNRPDAPTRTPSSNS